MTLFPYTTLFRSSVRPEPGSNSLKYGIITLLGHNLFQSFSQSSTHFGVSSAFHRPGRRVLTRGSRYFYRCKLTGSFGIYAFASILVRRCLIFKVLRVCTASALLNSRRIAYAILLHSSASASAASVSPEPFLRFPASERFDIISNHPPLVNPFFHFFKSFSNKIPDSA